ncbi:MAG: 4-hydroxythreonine-4-phosphate dehydrogenase PdxA, partial [Betaproteobacteria bacterium]|nr:4-hydroxythreonine-4-phosphate dehydrogenase PdxA [Betaproteobacteria bacterium]
GVVTAPIAKAPLYAAGFRFPGHTEFLAELTADAPFSGTRGPVMMLTARDLRACLVTIHAPLAEVPELVTVDRVCRTARVVHEALRRDFGIAAPRLALAALNPHAGEAGAFGREEIELLSPCVAEAQAQGILIEGPLAADSVFARAWNNPQIDAVIALYHDQGLIPIKLLGMDLGVNITLGLPFVRTSPDHGTAFDIAGKGIAREASLLAALKAADHYSLKQAYEHGAEGASAVQS